MENTKKANKIIKKTTSILIYFFIAFLIFYFVINIFFPRKIITIFKSQSFVILTSSMVPAGINVGDLVIVKEIDFDNLEKGDIISFYVDANEDGEMDVVTHFFDNIEEVNGVKLYRTKSAVSNQLDGWYIHEADIIGEYVTHFPKVGKLVLYLRSPIGLITLAIDFIIIYLLFSIVDDSKEKEKVTLEQTDKLNENMNK